MVTVLLVQRKWGGAICGGKEGKKEGKKEYHNCVLAFDFRVDHRILICLYSFWGTSGRVGMVPVQQWWPTHTTLQAKRK